MSYDVVIAGAGPAGLSAALLLGRARKRVLVCDAGSPRNAVAEGVHNFLTRDGTPPAEMHRIAREQLVPYDSVEVRDAGVQAIEGEIGRFRVSLASGDVEARRVLLCLGVIDELPDIPGFRELWGKAIFQCPYCHAWEVRDRAFGFLGTDAAWLSWAPFLRGWTDDLVVFTDGQFEVPEGAREKLSRAGIGIEERRIRRLVSSPGGDRLEAVEMDDGGRVPRAVLFARPPQRQPPLVDRIGVDLDDLGFVRIDDQSETSRPGIYAAGDLTTPKQSAILAAAAGVIAAAALNHELTIADTEGNV